MVMTILEAHVEPAKSSGLEKEFTEATKKLDEGITETLLVKSLSDPTLWRILTIWSSREALNAMRSSATTGSRSRSPTRRESPATSTCSCRWHARRSASRS